MLVELNSKGMVSDTSSSFLSELKGLVSALNDAKTMIHGRLVVLWANSQSVFKQLTGTNTDPKKIMDKRVSCLLAWLWGNYPSS